MTGKSKPPDSNWRRQFEFLLNSIPDAILIFDAAENLLASNDAALQLTDYRRADAARLSRRDLLHLEGTADDEAPLEGELICRSGKRIPVEVRCAHHRNGAW